MSAAVKAQLLRSRTHALRSTTIIATLVSALCLPGMATGVSADPGETAVTAADVVEEPTVLEQPDIDVLSGASLLAARPRVIPLTSGSVKEPGGTYECAANAVLIARAHSGDENKDTAYTCARVRFESVEVQTQNAVWGHSHKESSGSRYQCPPSMALTGRKHVGDENGSTQYRCSTMVVDGHPVALGMTTWSPRYKENAHNFTCPDEQILVGRLHDGDENGLTTYACSGLRFDRTAATTSAALGGTRLACPAGSAAGRDTGTGFTCVPLALRGVAAEVLATQVSSWNNAATHDFLCEVDTFVVAREFRSNGAEMRITCGSFAVESDRMRWSGSPRDPLLGAAATDCPPNSAQVGRKRTSGGTPTITCADLVADHSATFAQIVAENARKTVGVPATLDPAHFANRTHLGLNDLEYLHLAVGGQGRQKLGGFITGFDRAINLSHRSKNADEKDIPNLVRVHDPLLAPPYPFTVGTVDYLTVENRQLTTAQAGEITRVLKPKGTVGLWLDMSAQVGLDGRQDAIVNALAARLKSSAVSCVDEFGAHSQFQKVCITDKR